ncbi:MAG: hypothetical protein ACYDCM_14120 [Candidatus Acidiferrales bacterium]
MSQNQSPIRIVVSDSFYKTILNKRAQDNERLAAEGLPPRTDELPYISESDANALAADEAQRRAARSSKDAAASLAPPPPTRGPLSRAAKAKIAERIAAIPGFDHHSRKCQICRSPHVDGIEQLYLQWESVKLICRYFQFADTDALYRHARAAGLDVLRRQNSRWVVEQFIEQWHTVKVTSSTVIRSIRALSCLDEKGRWTDPPSTHILVRGNDASAADARSSDSGLPEPGATSTTDIREASPPPVFAPSATTDIREASSAAVSAGEVEGSPSIEQREPRDENSSPDSPFTGH